MPDDESETETTNTFLGVRVPEELREKIRAAAKLEDRTESSFARYHLSRAADALLGPQTETTNTGATEE